MFCCELTFCEINVASQKDQNKLCLTVMEILPSWNNFHPNLYFPSMYGCLGATRVIPVIFRLLSGMGARYFCGYMLCFAVMDICPYWKNVYSGLTFYTRYAAENGHRLRSEQR